MNTLSERMQAFVRDELDKLGVSQTFLQEKMEAYQTSEQEVNEQTAQSRDHMNEVLEEIKTLREDVKEKIGAGLDELSGAAETISANIITELEAFHMQVHASYASLGRDFKTTFDDLVRDLNEQQADNEHLHQQVLDANTALIEANKASQATLVEVVEEEKEQSAVDRQQLLTQITALVSANAEAQEKRLSEKLSSVSERISAANVAFESRQGAYTEGVNAWSNRSRDILAGVSKSRDVVKTKIKSDFAVSSASDYIHEHMLINIARPLLSTLLRSRIPPPPFMKALSRLSRHKWHIWICSYSHSTTLSHAFVNRTTLTTSPILRRLPPCRRLLPPHTPVLVTTCPRLLIVYNLWNPK